MKEPNHSNKQEELSFGQEQISDIRHQTTNNNNKQQQGPLSVHLQFLHISVFSWTLFPGEALGLFILTPAYDWLGNGI